MNRNNKLLIRVKVMRNEWAVSDKCLAIGRIHYNVPIMEHYQGTGITLSTGRIL